MGAFYCPNGHRISYGNSELERLERGLAQAQKRLEWANQATGNELRAALEAADRVLARHPEKQSPEERK